MNKSRNMLILALIVFALMSLLIHSAGAPSVALGAQDTTPTPTAASTTAPTQAATLEALPSRTPDLVVPTPTMGAFPRVRTDIRIAQQDFQYGYMFWLSNTRTIWVLLIDKANPDYGEWRIYRDSFVEGDPEVDPTIKTPAGYYQPIRGFGKLWRTAPGLRDTIGWATTPEFEVQTVYIYQPGGYFDDDGQYVPAAGRHFISTLSRQTFVLYEGADGMRWQRIN